ncbi:ribosome silencing factor [Mobilicoccus sp.]|uniref:ribosome silencing factor n=1 Tax=Mobilicoccus sp. TaxID=2034349 RepID=UPI0028AB9DB4|nr:ribosome silencing factor [Mobilicoccus sp.]
MAATPEALIQARLAAEAADDKLATDIVAIDVSGHLALTDVFVIASAPTDRQVQAIVDAVERAMHESGVKPLRREGEREGHWVLLDFGDIVVHVMRAEDRMFYQLERLWKDCPIVPLEGLGARSEGEAIEA